MQMLWKLVTGTTVVALLVGASALAYGDEGVIRTLSGTQARVSRAAPDTCPPKACTIVMKTDRGGPPSAIYRPN